MKYFIADLTNTEEEDWDEEVLEDYYVFRSGNRTIQVDSRTFTVMEIYEQR